MLGCVFCTHLAGDKNYGRVEEADNAELFRCAPAHIINFNISKLMLDVAHAYI